MFSGLKGASWANLSKEISAGLTLAALIIPLNIGYAQVAGLPPVFGLYAGIFPLAVFALFTGSRHLVGSADASGSAVIGAILLSFAPAGDPLRVQYALALGLMCGLVFIVFWFFRLAFLSNFLSRAVMTGYLTGLGISVITNQFRRILGAADIEKLGLSAFGQQIQETMASSVNTTGYFAELIVLFKSIPYLNLYSVAVGLGTMVFIRWMKKSFPRIPAALLALVLMTGVVAIFSLDQKGIQVLGAIPSGLPSLSLPHVPLLDYLRLLPGAIAVVAITLCEGLLLVRSTSRKHNTKADGNQVLFGYGMAALTSGVTGALIISNSPSRTAAVDAAGSRTQVSSLVGAAAVALIMLFFTDLLAYLPTAALAGVVAAAVLNLIEIRAFREFWHMRRSEFWVALVCLISVLVFGPLQAVLIAFLMATIDLLRRASRPRTWVLQQAPDSSYFVPEEPGRAKVDSDIIIYRFGSSLYFANAAFFENEVEKLLDRAHPPIRWLVLDAQAINDVDITGAEALEQVSGLLKLRGVTLAVSRVNPSVAKLMDTYHLTEVIGKTRFFSTNRHAIASFRKETGQQTISETNAQ
jgi:high affinity sulfate transporter 1